ncbi:hypothetical protein GCM10023198_47010 [Promicromonospora umidemergens]|uniref:Uncharacterized protein n=1 Tax=Promicromonospora umidemergens TaxID=629679 RepID=A0ABP8Y0D5_9MICO
MVAEAAQQFLTAVAAGDDDRDARVLHRRPVACQPVVALKSGHPVVLSWVGTAAGGRDLRRAQHGAGAQVTAGTVARGSRRRRIRMASPRQ